MKCAWQAFINLLPVRMRDQVDNQGRDTLQELRLRLGYPPEMLMPGGSVQLNGKVTQEELSFVINTASKYSPWAASTICRGYITAPGGHRVGLCGEALVSNGSMIGITRATSLCVRVARDFPGIARELGRLQGSAVIIGCPGTGKTTLLRDLIRQRAEQNKQSIAVVDERGEIFPHYQGQVCFPPGPRTDVLTGCSKVQGTQLALRCMGPKTIAVDEITAKEDCDALLHVGWCGVSLLATAHAGGKMDLFSRPIYQPIVKSGLFQHLIILQQDKSWKVERMYADD